MDKCKIILFSDLHYGLAESGIHFGEQRKLPHLAEPILEKLIPQINSVNPDVVVSLGDLIENINNRNVCAANLKYLWNLLQEINAPFYSVIGNHDINTLGRLEAARIMGYPNPTFSVNIKGYHFVFLGLHFRIEDIDGKHVREATLGKTDLLWLEKDIESNKLPSLIFLHYGIAEDELEGNWWGEKKLKEYCFLQDRKELKSILRKDKNLLAVFSGHQHWTKIIVEDDVPYYLVGSLTENINSDGKPDGVWLEFDLNGRELKTKIHHVKL